MTATNHALTGAVIATVIRQPLLAVPLAFASHFLCDALPHFGVNLKFNSKAMYTWLLFDGLAALLAAGLLLKIGVQNPMLLAICGFVAMSPDLSWLYYGLKHKLGIVKSYDLITKFHHKIQWYQKIPGIFVEFTWAVLMVVIILQAQPS